MDMRDCRSKLLAHLAYPGTFSKLGKYFLKGKPTPTAWEVAARLNAEGRLTRQGNPWNQKRVSRALEE